MATVLVIAFLTPEPLRPPTDALENDPGTPTDILALPRYIISADTSKDKHIYAL